MFPRFNASARFREWEKAFCFAALFWIASSGPGFCEITSSANSNFLFDAWRTEDGLPQNSVTAIVQSGDGYLWFGTYNGLVRFDGVHCTVFDNGTTPQMSSSRVTSLFEDASDNLWIGHETGDLTQFRYGSFTHVALPSGSPDGPIIAIDKDSEGTLWLLNKAGWLFSTNGAQLLISDKNSTNGPGVPSLARDVNGTLWVVRAGVVGSMKKGRLSPWLPGGKENTNYFQTAVASHAGGLWLVGNERIARWNGSGPVADLGPAPWGQSFVTALLETRSGDLLAGTLNEGLFLISPDGTQQQFTRSNGLSHDWVRCLCEDREGSVWVGTGGGGLNAMRRRTVEMVKTPDDWQGRALLSVSPGADNSVWVGTEGGGLYQLNGETPVTFGQTNGLANLFIWSVLEDRKHKLWVGTWGNGIFARQGESFQPPAWWPDPTAAVLALYQGRNGTLWIGAESGLGCFQNGQCSWLTRQDGLVLPDVRAISEDSEGVIWFGMSGGGLGRLQNGKLTQFRKADGLASDFVWSLLAEDNGTLWIGTFGGGLSRFLKGKFTTVSTSKGLPNNVICHIADDGRGNFWMSSYGGIFRVSKEELRQCADGTVKELNCFTYGKADGLSTLECSGGFQPSGCQTPDGRLWFPTSKGLAVVDPAQARINPLAPKVVIESVMVDGEPVALPSQEGAAAGQLQIQPGKQRFEFHCSGLSLIAPQKVRFKYRLDGSSEDWEQAGTRRVAYYGYLKPGEYTFHVTACNNDGVWNEQGAKLTLRVLPYFWQTWWFTVGMIVAGAGLVAGTARYITRRRLKQKMELLERQRALEKERARIAKDIHDDLGASLTRITLLSQSSRADLEDPHSAAADFDQIYVTARGLTQALEEIVWAVSPQHDTLDSLATYLGKFAQDFLSVAGVRLRLNVPMQLPAWPLTAEVRHNLFLAFKEALNNVLKHASATEVRVSLALTPSGFALSVDDNGRGFHPAEIGKSAVERADRDVTRLAPGNGLENMRKRLEEIGGVFELRSSPGEGTRVGFLVKVIK